MGIAAGAHLLGGGRLPSVGVLGVVAFLLGLSAVVLTARRCRFLVLLGVLAVQQGLLHVLLDTAGRVSAGCGLTTAGLGHAAMTHAVVAAPAGQADGPCSMGSMGSMGSMAGMFSMAMPGWAMWAAHLAAVALTAALLARGEAWLWRATAAVVRASTVRPSAWSATRHARVVVTVPVAVRQLLLPSSGDPRGPPAGPRRPSARPA